MTQNASFLIFLVTKQDVPSLSMYRFMRYDRYNGSKQVTEKHFKCNKLLNVEVTDLTY